MIIFSNNLAHLPVFILLWVINGYLLLVAARFLIANTIKACPLDQALRQLTDPLPVAAERWIGRVTRKRPQRWAIWLMVVGALLLVQHLLMALVALTR
jgi:hypothetical protein